MRNSWLRLQWFTGGAIVAAVLILVGRELKMPTAEAAGDAPALAVAAASLAQEDDRKLRIICFGAHPDDAEFRAAGVAAMWAAKGHHVKFVSVTNGDIGHWGMAGGPLAQRRTSEVLRCAEILGIESEVLDIHDGELLPTLENRKIITGLIRDWRADVVICHRPNDYHPDHRNTGLLVQDAAFMVTVPFFCPDSPYLDRNPVFLYFQDRFQKPNPFSADVVVGIDDVVEQKLSVVETLASQTLEGGCNGSSKLWPADAEGQLRRQKDVRQRFQRRFASTADRFREELVSWYGEARGKSIASAEAFEICEYGSQPSQERLRELFPFFAD